MCGIAHSHCNIGTCIIRRIGRRRNKLIEIKILFIRTVYDLLAWSRFLCNNRRNRMIHTTIKHFSQIFRFSAKKSCHPLSACQKPNCNSCPGMSFYIIKNHGRSFFCRAHHRSSCSHMSIYAGQFRHRLHFRICFYQLSLLFSY